MNMVSINAAMGLIAVRTWLDLYHHHSRRVMITKLIFDSLMMGATVRS